MKYQLVLQFDAESTDALDQLVSLEDKLIEKLGDAASVDGHDFGSGEFNIFIETDDPNAAFSVSRGIVADSGIPNAMRAAYRDMKSEHYEVLWPPSLTEFSVL